MTEKLFSSELRVMELLWKNGPMSAKELAAELGESVNWSKTTTYTVIKKCIEKGAVNRTDPGFLCEASISQDEIRKAELFELMDRLFGGKPDLLVSALIRGGKITQEQLDGFRSMVAGMEED